MRIIFGPERLASKERSEDLKFFKEESEGRSQTSFQHEGTDCQEEESRGRIFLPLQ